jgi:hypothetical protein
VTFTEGDIQLFITTPTSTYVIPIVELSIPPVFFQSMYGCSLLMSISPPQQIDNLKLNPIVTISLTNEESTLTVEYSEFVIINFNNHILPVGIGDASDAFNVTVQVKTVQPEPSCFFTAWIDPSLSNSVVVFVPFPNTTTETTYTTDITTSSTSSGWTWVSSSITTTQFSALIQDTVSLEFLYVTALFQLSLTNTLDAYAVWNFELTTSNQSSIASYVQSPTEYVSSSSQCSRAPCLTFTPCFWNITLPSSFPTNTNPFTTTLSSQCSGSTEYMIATLLKILGMSDQITTYRWNIIPLAFAS